MLSRWTIGAIASKKARASPPVAADRLREQGAGQRPGRDDRRPSGSASTRSRTIVMLGCAATAAVTASQNRSPAARAPPSARNGPAARAPPPARRRTSPAPAAPPPRRAPTAPRSPAAPSPGPPGGWPSARARTATGRPAPPAAAALSRSAAIALAAALSLGMRSSSNATGRSRVTQGPAGEAAALRRTVVWGAVGVLLFSFSLPATRLAVRDLDGTFVGLGRALVAAALAAVLLAVRRERPPAARGPQTLRARRPRRRDRLPGGDLARARADALRARQRRRRAAPRGNRGVGGRARRRAPAEGVLAAAGAGLVAVLAFAATQGVNGIDEADLLVLARRRARRARLRGGRRARAHVRRLAGDLLGARALRAGARRPDRRSPPATASTRTRTRGSASPTSSVISMFLAFFAWYHALALGGVAKIGQIQLGQPVLTLFWSALVLGEHVTAAMVRRGARGPRLRPRDAAHAPPLSRRRTRAAACPRR